MEGASNNVAAILASLGAAQRDREMISQLQPLVDDEDDDEEKTENINHSPLRELLSRSDSYMNSFAFPEAILHDIFQRCSISRARHLRTGIFI